MDQTIIIGDMEDMNIFDDIKMDSAKKEELDDKKPEDENTITFKHEEF